MTGQSQAAGAEAGALLLGVDLQSLDVDSLLGPLASRGSRSLGFRQRPPRVGVEGLRADEVISSQKKALEQPAPAQTVKAKAANCLAHGPALVGGKCGERMFFIVTTVSPDGQVMKEGGASVTCIVTARSLMSKTHPEPRPFVEDRQDGTYHVQFVCATPGVYEISACVDGAQVAGTMDTHGSAGPVAVTVTPSAWSVRGDGSQRCTLGGSAEFTIQAMDEFGNLCGEGGARFGVRASAHVRLHEVSDNEDGTYTVTYSIPDWAQGPIKLEVLLDGHPIRGSPLMPRIIGFVPEKADPAVKGKASQGRVQKGAGGTFADQLPSLRWLRENQPLPVPDIPPPDVTAMAATGGLNGFGKVGDRSLEGASEASVSRLAWSAADEWRRLAEVRSELERSRDQLVEHQAVLLHVGDAIHTEVDRLQEWERNIKSREDELGDVEKQLEGMRSEIQKQYLTQKRLLETMSAKDQPCHK
ncbi:abpC [Symbiodinium pilosum]|uniref:AbpC protein n=1 Tax=Symbiodinium pilosum TaxID=2952 RepID=A0A812WIM9_SYMPI|nr:abpC [Symbiodinium pilosum]